jgi:NAD-reducing hydrogenase large subunit
VVPGGVNEPLTAEKRDAMLAMLPEALDHRQGHLRLLQDPGAEVQGRGEHFGTMKTLFLSLVSPEGNLEHCNGFLRIKDAQGRIVEDMVPPQDYQRSSARRSRTSAT